MNTEQSVCPALRSLHGPMLGTNAASQVAFSICRCQAQEKEDKCWFSLSARKGYLIKPFKQKGIILQGARSLERLLCTFFTVSSDSVPLLQNLQPSADRTWKDKMHCHKHSDQLHLSYETSMAASTGIPGMNNLPPPPHLPFMASWFNTALSKAIIIIESNLLKRSLN